MNKNQIKQAQLQQRLLQLKIDQNNVLDNEILQSIVSTMIYVQGGFYLMGCDSETDENGRIVISTDETPSHLVVLNSFYMSKHPITQEQWSHVMGDESYKIDDESIPITVVSWKDTQDFIGKIKQITNFELRLPTEAEWEYAARGGKSFGYKFAGSNNINEVAWYEGNSVGNPHTVCTKKSNSLEIFDMSGNVFEWCQDWYDSDYYENSPFDNPTGPPNGSQKVIRGGSYKNEARVCRVAYRDRAEPNSRYYNIGFRLVRDL